MKTVAKIFTVIALISSGLFPNSRAEAGIDENDPNPSAMAATVATRLKNVKDDIEFLS